MESRDERWAKLLVRVTKFNDKMRAKFTSQGLTVPDWLEKQMQEYATATENLVTRFKNIFPDLSKHDNDRRNRG